MFNQTKYLSLRILTQIEAVVGKRVTEEDHPEASRTRPRGLGLDLKWTQRKQQIWMTAKGESNKEEPIRRDLLLITDLIGRNPEEETGAIIDGLKRFNCPASEIGYTLEKILNYIRVPGLIGMSLQRHTTTMWQSIRKIKNMNSTKNISLSLGSWRDMTQVKSSIGKLCRLAFQKLRQRILKLL